MSDPLLDLPGYGTGVLDGYNSSLLGTLANDTAALNFMLDALKARYAYWVYGTPSDHTFVYLHADGTVRDAFYDMSALGHIPNVAARIAQYKIYSEPTQPAVRRGAYGSVNKVAYYAPRNEWWAVNVAIALGGYTQVALGAKLPGDSNAFSFEEGDIVDNDIICIAVPFVAPDNLETILNFCNSLRLAADNVEMVILTPLNTSGQNALTTDEGTTVTIDALQKISESVYPALAVPEPYLKKRRLPAAALKRWLRENPGAF